MKKKEKLLEEKLERDRRQYNQSVIRKDKIAGITLVALVVTIVVLLILAGITIVYVFGDNSIFKLAQDAKNKTEQAKQDEQDYLSNIDNTIDKYVDGKGGATGGSDDPKDLPLASTVTETNHETTKVKDTHGNVITVPQGFKVVAGSTGEEITVQNGVVIEDSTGNQFVWIPVGEVTLNDGTTKKEIKLGRYTFDLTTGNPTMAANSYQYAYTEDNLTNYTNEVTIESCYKELSTAREGLNWSFGHHNDLNATAKNLKGFVDSVRSNGGFYLARFEASYGGGYTDSGSASFADYQNAKPLSRPSEASSFDVDTVGSLWNNISQINATKVARNMYTGNQDINGNTVGVESDLVNSYAWDTAIVYITEMGNTNFANKKRDDVGGVTSLANTGSNSSDKYCNVYDMVANTSEWTTEYAYAADSSGANPCVDRGGGYDYGFTALRSNENAVQGFDAIAFRPCLYIK